MTTFAKIRAVAAKRKGGNDVLETLVGPMRDNSELATVTDDRVLSAMAERIFSAGIVWKVIRDKWPGFEEAFLGFQPKPLLFQPDEYWHDLTKDTRIVRNPQKIKAVRANAEFVGETAAAHGSFGKFLAEWPEDDQAGLLAHLGKHGSRLGGNTGQYFLRWIGWDGWITSGDMIRALRGAGLDISEKATSKRDLVKIQEQLNAYRAESGLGYAQISRVLAFSTGDNYDADTIRERTGGGS